MVLALSILKRGPKSCAFLRYICLFCWSILDLSTQAIGRWRHMSDQNLGTHRSDYSPIIGNNIILSLNILHFPCIALQTD
jgi:hypothetical protein